VIVEQGWRSGATTPSVHAVGAAIGHLLAGLESLDLVAGSRDSGLELKPIRQLALHIGLRARARTCNADLVSEYAAEMRVSPFDIT
jgi:hypothetical protein